MCNLRYHPASCPAIQLQDVVDLLYRLLTRCGYFVLQLVVQCSCTINLPQIDARGIRTLSR